MMLVTPTWRLDAREAGRAWLGFIGPDASYPREVMTPSLAGTAGRKQHHVENAIDLVDVLTRHAHRGDVWVSARPTTLFHEPIHTRFWADVDANGDIEKAIRLREHASKFCRDILGTEPYWQFSGSKGFHGHLDHGPVRATSEQYRMAIKKLMRESRVDPGVLDMNVVGKYRAMPRPPYTGNTNAIEHHGEMLYTVPVDLSMAAETVLRESRDPSPRTVRIPFARDAAALIQEVVDELPPASSTPTTFRDKPPKKQIDEVIHFLSKAAPKMTDGHKRALRLLLIPTHLHVSGGSESAAREEAQRFIEASNLPWSRYRTYVDAQIRATKLHDGRILRPMGLRKFFSQNPDILRSMAKK